MSVISRIKADEERWLHHFPRLMLCNRMETLGGVLCAVGNGAIDEGKWHDGPIVTAASTREIFFFFSQRVVVSRLPFLLAILHDFPWGNLSFYSNATNFFLFLNEKSSSMASSLLTSFTRRSHVLMVIRFGVRKMVRNHLNANEYWKLNFWCSDSARPKP